MAAVVWFTIAVALWHVAEDVVVRPILLNDVKHVIDRRALAEMHRDGVGGTSIGDVMSARSAGSWSDASRDSLFARTVASALRLRRLRAKFCLWRRAQLGFEKSVSCLSIDRARSRP